MAIHPLTEDVKSAVYLPIKAAMNYVHDKMMLRSSEPLIPVLFEQVRA